MAAYDYPWWVALRPRGIYDLDETADEMVGKMKQVCTDLLILLKFTSNISNIENTTIHIKTSHSELTISGSLQITQNHPADNWYRRASQHSCSYHLAYDLNSNHYYWFSSHKNPSGTVLTRYTDTRMDIAVIVADSPTHYLNNPYHLLDTLDLAIIKTSDL